MPYWAPSASCRGCGEPSIPRSYVCPRCRRLLQRVETRKDAGGRGRKIDIAARLAAMHRQWDTEAAAFRCLYTGLTLTDSHGSRRSATWEHRIPGDESSVVLVADLVNKMKGDMTEHEFRRVVQALARHFEAPGFDEGDFPLDPSR